MVQVEASAAVSRDMPVKRETVKAVDQGTIERAPEELMDASRVDDSGGSTSGVSTEEPVETGSDD